MNLFHKHEWEEIGKYYKTEIDEDGSKSYKCYTLHKCLKCEKEKSVFVVYYSDFFDQDVGNILKNFGYVPKHIFELERGRKIK